MSAGDLPDGLIEMNLDELRSVWIERTGEPPPRLRAPELMALALAYRLQARAHGDLPGVMKRRTAELARRFANDPKYAAVVGPALKPGSSLIKEWRGVRHEVRVLEQGFSYQGEPLGSLSEAAERITGTKWNGQVFFGLKARAR